MKVISYNLRKHRAIGELTEIVQRHSPDVLCLQECDDRALPEFIGDLHLSDATARNRLGLAVYHRNGQFTVQKTKAFELKRSLYDRVAKPAHERLIAVRLRDEEHDRELVVASFHAAPLTALNSLRRKQIHAALAEMQLMGPGLPVLMVGDYNYPVFKAGLSDKITASGYDLTLSDSRTYTRYKVFRGHFDLATSVGLTIESVVTLPRGSSDHLPILVTSSYTGAAASTSAAAEAS